MKLRLIVRNDGPATVVEVHGELLTAAIAELDRACRTRGELVIDLANLRHIDSAAAARLRELSMGRATLVGGSQYIKMLIEAERR